MELKDIEGKMLVYISGKKMKSSRSLNTGVLMKSSEHIQIFSLDGSKEIWPPIKSDIFKFRDNNLGE